MTETQEELEDVVIGTISTIGNHGENYSVTYGHGNGARSVVIFRRDGHASFISFGSRPVGKFGGGKLTKELNTRSQVAMRIDPNDENKVIRWAPFSGFTRSSQESRGTKDRAAMHRPAPQLGHRGHRGATNISRAPH